MPSTGGLNLGIFLDFDKNKAKSTKNDIQEYMNELQRLINKDALEVTVTVDASKTSQFLRYIKMSTKELKQEAKDLEKQLEVLQRTGKYRDPHTNRLTQEATELLQKYRELQTVRERVTLTLAETNKRVNQSLKEQAKAVQKLSGEYKKQDSYLSNLLKKMATYASIGAMMDFLTKIREVTAEFELQRISLGAIIQDQNKANALFSEIKNFALKSPVKILDLTTYTKQLAAYRIETDKLFDTTKRLADISVGLGVDMQRIILFYGQVRAAGYLRASEVRQATEAGIPLVEELAKKLSQARGELVTVGQVMDMISKRQISFQDVADVFEDLTNKGGIFYNMQEKQGNTLYGMWQKLGDAAQVMYDQIGNTDSVNNTLKGSINLLRTLMLNWREVARAIMVAGTGFATWKINSAIMAIVVSQTMNIENALWREIAAEDRLNAAKAMGNKLQVWSATWKLRAAKMSVKAAEANNILTASYYRAAAGVRSLMASLSAFWPMLLVTIGVGVWQYFDAANEKANRLKKALDEVRESANIEISKSVQNFESLANAAVNARDGSKEQRDALEELQTTYGKMIPAQDLQIEKLREMKGNYDLLTEAIRNNIAAQKMQEGVTTIIENYTAKEKEWSDKVRDAITKNGIKYTLDGVEGILKVQDTQFDRMIRNVEKLARSTNKNVVDIWKEVLSGEGFDPRIVESFKAGFISKSNQFVQALRQEELALNNWKKEMKNAYAELGLFAPYIEEAKKNIENATFTSEKGTFEFEQERVNKTVEEYTNAIRRALEYKKSKINLDDFITIDETSPERLMAIDFEGLQKAIADEGGELNIQVRDLVKVIQGEWASLVPSDPVVYQVRNNLLRLADGVDESIRKKLLRSLWDGSAGIDEHLKTLKGQIEQYEADLQRMKNAVKVGGFVGLLNQLKYGKQIEETEKILELLREQFEFEEKYTVTKDKNKGGDTRIQTLQEINQTLEKINKEYNEMLKLEGETQATQRLKKDFKDTLDYINKLGNQFGLKFDFPTQFSSLQQYRKEILKVMKTLQNLKGGEKAILEFQTMISTADFNEAQKQIERKLKDLQDKIAQSKTAKEFYDKILSATGDVDIAANVTMSIYGEDGTALQAEIAQQITEMFGSFQVDVPVDVVTPENRVDYTALQKFLDENRDAWADKDQFKALEKLASEGQKASAKQVEAWFKEIQKAKDYAQKRVDIETELANKIAGIRAEMLPKDVEETLISGMTEKAAQELDKLQYEAFKDSPMYVELFQNLEHASTTALKAMRDRLIALKGQWQNLDPTQVKELTNAIQKLDDQIIKNNPFKSIVDNLTKLRNMKSQKVLDEKLQKELAKLQKAEENLTKAAKKYADAQNEVENAETDVAIARKKLNDSIDSEDYDAVKEAQKELNLRLKILEEIKKAHDDNMRIAKREKDQAQEEYDKQKKITDEAEKEALARKQIVQGIEAANAAIDHYQAIINDVLDDVREMMEALAVDDIDLQFFDDIVKGLNQIVDSAQSAATAVGAFMTGDLFTGITSSITSVAKFVTGFINLFYAGRVRKANKEIERQNKLLDQLEYSYSRLQKAQEKLFGSQYIQNYNQQLQNLSAQAEAYRKQMEAEQSKGKKADQEKIKEYENAWRDTMDEIKDMRDELVNYFAGTDITSAARDFANSWLEARWAFEDTTEAMREKFADMVQNMIVESMAAKLMHNILDPIYKMIDEATADNDITVEEIAAISAKAYESIGTMNDAMETMLAQLEQAGLDLSQMFSEGGTDLTGISRDIATASEESINGLAQGINTQNYYISHVPTISENVAAIRILMEGGAVAQVGGDYNTLQNEHLAQLPVIAANTLATAERCERAAVACEEMADNIRRVVISKGGKFTLNTTIN